MKLLQSAARILALESALRAVLDEARSEAHSGDCICAFYRDKGNKWDSMHTPGCPGCKAEALLGKGK